MSKKILAIFMAVAMAFSLLPVTAVAVDGEATPPVTNVTASQDGVKISKEVVTDDNGNHSLVMEAYVEGNTETITSSKPLDIVLVLDVSGSMDDSMGEKDSTKRIDALKSAVNSFIDEVAKNNPAAEENPVGHRISIVKFAGNKSENVGNEMYESGRYTYNYSQIVKNLTDVDATGKNALKTAVNSLKPAGATRSDNGLALAQGELSKDSTRGKVVIMFTDGAPSSFSDFDNDVASEAITTAKDLKSAGTKIYTVGIFSGADPSKDPTKKKTNIKNKYMQAVSSNYPDATFSGGWSFGTRATGNYYLAADDAAKLNKVFEKISQSITTSAVTADADAVLRDTLTEQFVFNGNENDVTVQKAKVTGKDESGNYTWATPVDVTGITKNISEKTITVRGFDYTSEENVITEKGNGYSGYKLVVTIPIKVNQDYTGWEAGTKNYNTNTTGVDNKAGLTGYKKGDKAASTLLTTSPQVPVTAYTVTYDWGETAPDGEEVPTDQNTYLEGKTYQVDTNYTSGKEVQDSEGGTYRFSGWTDPSNGVMGTNDVTITGSWTYSEPTPPPAPTYTLTYDANGGYFGSEATTTKEEMIAATGDHDLNYTDEYTPTHAQTSEGKNVIFLGWSAEQYENVFTKDDVADAEGIASSIITKVNIQNSTTTVYAVWSLDENNNNIPDIFEATVTYKIENGYWFRSEDGKNIDKNDKNVTITLYEKAGHIWKKIDAKLGDTIPTGHGGEKGYTAQGWYKDSEVDTVNIEAATPVTGNVTYTFKYTNVSMPTTYTVVLHLENGAYTTVPDGYTITSTSGVYQYTVTEPTTIVKPDTTTLSRSGYDFQGWSLSKTDSQTLIEENETFTALYVKQNGLTGNYDKIDLYAVWKKVDPPVDPVKWDVSCSKIATNLDSNYESKVKLSLPSAEEKLESDVVFVLDGSSSAETGVVQESLSLLEELKQAAGEDGAAVNVCIVKFKRQAFKSDWYDLSKDFDAIKTAMETKYSGGTNLHAGLLAGKEALEEHTNVSANRKYLILVSDGSTYLYSKDGNWASDKPFTRTYYTKENFNKTATGGYWDNGFYEPNNYPDVNIPRPKTTSDVAIWQAYLKDVEARNTESHRDDYDYHCDYDLNFNQGIPSEDFKSQPCEKRTANNRDMAFYYANQVWQQIKDAGYKAYSIATEDGSAGAGNADDSHCFMNYLNDGKSLNFSEIQNEIIYAVSAGSKVADTIGDKFTFGGVKSFTLTVGDSEMKGTVEENTVNFGDVKQDGSYPYTVTYTPDTKTFVWTINENVSNFAPVQLTYTVKLTKPETAAGTYGQTDLNGDTFIDGTQTTVDSSKALYTNEKATLTPVDSQGEPGADLEFPKPSVSYTVSGGNSGGNNGGNSRPSLNTKDHYGYIIGYPVDYYTGQPTTDQTKKPVRPEGKITRAEVATIYFRMLTDESRAKFWSQSNAYSDVKAGDWFNNAVSTLSNAGIIAGYEDGSFRPNGYITRAEFATIAARFFDAAYDGKDLFPDISGHWAKDYINQAANKGFVNGYEDGTFRPDRNITRAEAVTLVNRTLERHPDKSHFTKDMLTWPDNMDTTKWYYADMQEATNSHTYESKENSDKTKYENWTKTLSIRNWEALEKAWSNANSSQGTGNVV